MTSLQNSTNLSKITIFERFWLFDSLELTRLNGAGSWELGAGSWELGENKVPQSDFQTMITK